MRKATGSKSDQTVPASFPETTPPLTLDQSFTLPTIMTMQHTLGGLEKSMERVETKLDKLGDDVTKHGHWIYAANAVIVLGLAILGFMAKLVWDIAKTRIGIPP